LQRQSRVARRLRNEAQLKNVFVLEGGWEEMAQDESLKR